MENVLAVIPARGGSKRIPKKNIKSFLGKPIIYYSIDAALKSNLFDEVMVSTDDEEVIEVSKKLGASVPFLRSPETASSNSPVKDVITEVLKQYTEKGKQFDYICCILPAAPLITVKNLTTTFELLKGKNIDAVVPVVRYGYPIQRAFKIEKGLLQMISPANMYVNSQDLSSSYHDAGQFYWLKVESFLKQEKIFMVNCLPFEIPESEVQDIDEVDDWKLAELKYSLLNK